MSSPSSSLSPDNGAASRRTPVSPLLSPLGSPPALVSPQPLLHHTAAGIAHAHAAHSNANTHAIVYPIQTQQQQQYHYSQQLPSTAGIHSSVPTHQRRNSGTPKLGTPRRLSLGNRDALVDQITYRSVGPSPGVGNHSGHEDEIGSSPKGHPAEVRKKLGTGGGGWKCCTLPFRLPSRRTMLFFGLAFFYAFSLMYFCRQSVVLPPSYSLHAGVCQGVGEGGGGAAGATSDLEQMNLQFTGSAPGVGGRPIQQLKCKACPECPDVAPATTSAVALTGPAATATPCPPPPECPPAAPAAPAAATVAASPQSSYTETRLLSYAFPTEQDSQGSVFSVRGRGSKSNHGDEYKLCSFTNVCIQNDKILLSHHDNAQIAAWKEEIATKCWKVEQWLQPPICSCFHPNFLPDFLDPAAVPALHEAALTRKWQHWWSVHKWVHVHHIAHWAQKLIIWQSLYQHTANLPLPRLDGLVFQDSDLPLSDHEEVIFDAVLKAIQPPDRHPVVMAAAEGPEKRAKHIIWAETLRAQKASIEAAAAAAAATTPPTPFLPSSSQLTCFPRLSFTPHYGIFSTHPDDTRRFREKVYERFGIEGASARCPPHRAVMLYRHNRGVINKLEVQSMLKKEFGIELEFQTIDENSSSETQVQLFASTGLMLSSHSSQLINVLFSPAGAAIVEIAPEFYNADFSEYAHGMGIFFQYALGGEIPGGKDQPNQRACVEHLSHCEGASYCILDQRYQCHNKEYPNKNLDFHANVTAIRIAVKNSIQHLNWLCTGRW